MARVELQTLIDRSVKNMGRVHSSVKDKVLFIITQAYREGINVQFSSGYRSNEQQNALYAKGRTAPGNIVTNAKAGQSVHNYGLAADFFLTTYDGSKAVWSVNKDWRRVAEIAKSLGFQWGGDWKSFQDNPHIDLAKGLTWRDLRAGRRPNAKLLNKGVTQEGHAGMSVAEIQEKLVKQGYSLKVDGIFGPGTDKVLKSFQRDRGLKVDGLAGPNTKKALLKKEEPKKEDDDMPKKAIVINSEADIPHVWPLHLRTKFPIFDRRVAEKEKVAHHLIVCGGGTDGLKGNEFTDLSGDNRYDTAEKIEAYLHR